jgi:hypothetical protein
VRLGGFWGVRGRFLGWGFGGGFQWGVAGGSPFLRGLRSVAEKAHLIIEQLKNKHQLSLTAENAQFINALVMKEYLAEFPGLQEPA